MYLPRHFDASADADAVLARLLERDAFVTLVSVREGAPFATHLPVLARRTPEGWLLEGHWARPNPQWEGIEGQTALAVVHGPHAYVSPRWYPDPHKAVPTWNYAAAHVYGRVELVTEPEALLDIVDRLSAVFESGAAEPWTRAAGDPSLASMARGIVGFRMRADRVEVKLKLGQNHVEGRVRGAIAGMRDEGSAGSLEIAGWMEEALAARPGRSQG